MATLLAAPVSPVLSAVGDVTVTSGDVTVTNGDVTVTNGDVRTVTNGDAEDVMYVLQSFTLQPLAQRHEFGLMHSPLPWHSLTPPQSNSEQDSPVQPGNGQSKP